MIQWAKIQKGFTIVELLIVVVVIAILAAITIVAYNGIQQNAQSASLKSNVSQAAKKLKSYAVTNTSTYPDSVSSCPNPVTGSVCLSSSDSQTITYAVDNAARSFCYSAQTASGLTFFTDETGSVLPGSCSLQSCYAIQQAGGSHGSGTYWIRPAGASQSQRVYCDMQTSGGGWTLILANPGPHTAWNTAKVIEVNQNTPSISTQYSILSQADNIKSNLGGKLNYRLDAIEFGRWGGVWEAPFSNTFTNTNVVNNGVNIEKYDANSWTIDTTLDDVNALTNIMPYINPTRLLTTWSGSGSWWGTIATQSSGFSPAPYMSNTPAANPGIIWYWVR